MRDEYVLDYLQAKSNRFAAVIHIRRDLPLQIEAVCGEPCSETISAFHYFDHVEKYRQECCKGVFERLCPKCLLKCGGD